MRTARVLVIAPLSRLNAARYATEVGRRLAVSAGAPVEVTFVSGADDRLAFRAARELDRRPALAALVAPARPGDAATAAVTKVCAMLRQRRQEAVVSSPLVAGPGEASGTSAEKALAAVADSRLPVSWLPAAQAGATGAGDGRRALVAAARANVQTLVRACWPGTLAPGLSSTRLGFAFVDARHTGVGVVSGSDTAAAALLQRLRLWGFTATRQAADDAGSAPARPGAAIAYRPGSREAALALAGDLGLPPGSVSRAGDMPRKLVVLDRPLSARTTTAPHPQGWGAVGANHVAVPSGLTATQQRAAADERGTRGKDQEHLTTGERELTALCSRSLQTRKVVLKDALEVRILLENGVVLDVRQSGADLRGRPVAVDRPVLSVLDDRIDGRLRDRSLRDDGEHQDQQESESDSAQELVTLMSSPPLNDVSSAQCIFPSLVPLARVDDHT